MRKKRMKMIPRKILITGLYNIWVSTSLILIIIANSISGVYEINSRELRNESQVSQINNNEEIGFSDEMAEKKEESDQKHSAAVCNQNSSIEKNVILEDITYQDVHDLLYGSKYLTDDEKAFLDNPDLINDVLATVNESNITKHNLLESIKDIDIYPYTDADESILGYYDPSRPTVINVKNYTDFARIRKDTISHEYIHLLQYHYLDYKMLQEACAEIVSGEYFEDTANNAYSDYVYLTKKLMEIIGPIPVWEYTFTGDFSLIESKVTPYLDQVEYNAFLDCLKHNDDSSDTMYNRVDKLDALLDTLYKRKYDDYASNDKVMPLLRSPYLKRYYFNKRLVNPKNSYYEDGKTITTVSMTLDEAIENEFLFVEEEIKEFISRDRIKNFLITHYNKGLTRHCVYSQGFSETGVSCQNGNVTVTGHLNNIEFSNVPEEQLIEDGIIEDCHYYYTKDKKKLSRDEYKNNLFDPNNKLNYCPDYNKCFDVSLNETGGVNISFSSKVYLATIYEKFHE